MKWEIRLKQQFLQLQCLGGMGCMRCQFGVTLRFHEKIFQTCFQSVKVHTYIFLNSNTFMSIDILNSFLAGLGRDRVFYLWTSFNQFSKADNSSYIIAHCLNIYAVQSSQALQHKSRTTDTQWRNKSKISEKLGRCGIQYIWEWKWMFGYAVKAISSLGVRSPCLL